MVRFPLLALCAGLITVPAWGADLYRWVDERGQVHYSDMPPPAPAQKARRLLGKPNVVEVAKESFDTRLARERHPVELFSARCGPVCDQAEEHLRKRGIPYTLRDPSRDPEQGVALKKLTGGIEIPVLVVGLAHQKGFEASTWDKLLDAAGYPRSPLMPVKTP